MSFSDRLDSIQQDVSINHSRFQKLAGIMGTIGMGAGLYLAYKTHSGVWGYLGFAFIGGMLGGTVGNVIGAATKKREPAA